MKVADINIGEEYLTKVGASLVRVKVTAAVSGRLNYSTGKDGPRRFECRRVDNGTNLPKARTASALREAPQAPPPKKMYAIT